MHNAEKDKRESRKQLLMTGVNTMTSALGQAFGNPKAVMKTAYFLFVIGGTL